jgi:6-pyruvoyltetrahydropterin/6-carboxytetrahydropterin synthase
MHTIAQRFHFSAAHTLRSSGMSAQENARVYGKCANPTGHGHDYVLEVIVSAPRLIDDVVVQRAWLEDVARQQLAAKFMFKNLNETFGDGFIPTGENLARAAWKLLHPHLPAKLSLTVRVVETPKNAFVFRGSGEQLDSKSV